MYDYLIIGAGWFGATFARVATDKGKRCLVIDKRNHIGGNAYSERRNGIDVHIYGPHIFHTNDERIWTFVNKYSEFNNFVLSPKVTRNGKMYSLPFNMNTFNQIWGCTRPSEARQIINLQKFIGDPTNLEEQALSLVGKDIYELLIRDYTRKQWQRDPKDLPTFIIKRLPLRFEYNDNYFDDRYQGIPVNGYTALFEKLLDGISCKCNIDFFENKHYWQQQAKKIVFTGKIDEFYNYQYGELDYRSLAFEHEEIAIDNFQGCAVVNYPDASVPYTRIIEHKHFSRAKTSSTIITKEIPTTWTRSQVPYYPINDDTNTAIYNCYKDRAEQEKNVIFGGRLAEYRYYDMHQVIASAMKTLRNEGISNDFSL